jgi:hypothetical protein
LDPPSSDSGSHHEAGGGTEFECQLYCGDDSMREPFFIGGFQLISNARQVDVFLTADSDMIAEENGSLSGTFLTSVKGLPVVSDDAPKLFKAQCVIPGGPRRVRSVRLAFHSVQPSAAASPPMNNHSFLETRENGSSITGSIRFKLKHIRWTLRTADVTPSVVSSSLVNDRADSEHPPISDQATVGSGSVAVPADNMTNIFALMNSTANARDNTDVIAAVSGLAMAFKSTEERLLQHVRLETSTVQTQMSVLSKQIQMLTDTLRKMELNQQESNSISLSRQERLEELLNSVLLEIQRAKVSPVNTVAKDGEQLEYSFVHESLTTR